MEVALRRGGKQLIRERASHVQRLQRPLEDANIKLDSASRSAATSLAAPPHTAPSSPP